MKKLFLSTIFLLSASQFSLAQTTLPTNNTISVDNVKLPLELKYLEDQGSNLVYLGNQDGLDGYLLESKDGKYQTCYLTPNGNSVVCGIMFGQGSLDETGVQIKAMQDRFKAASENKSANLPDTTGTNTSLDKTASNLPTSVNTVGSSANNVVTPNVKANLKDNIDVSVVKLPTQANSDVKISNNNSIVTPLKSESMGEATNYLSPLNKQDFLAQVKDVGWFTVGDPSAPIVYLVVDPQCPYCHAVWAKLAPMALAHKLTLRIIMIAGLPGSEPLALSILADKNPGLLWESGEGSTDDMQIPAPPAENTQEYNNAMMYLTVNEKFASNIGLTGTPLLAYVGTDGNLYSVEGPKHLDKFLSHLN